MSFTFRSSWFSLALHDPAFRPRIVPGKSLASNPKRPPTPAGSRSPSRAVRKRLVSPVEKRRG